MRWAGVSGGAAAEGVAAEEEKEAAEEKADENGDAMRSVRVATLCAVQMRAVRTADAARRMLKAGKWRMKRAEAGGTELHMKTTQRDVRAQHRHVNRTLMPRNIMLLASRVHGSGGPALLGAGGFWLAAKGAAAAVGGAFDMLAAKLAGRSMHGRTGPAADGLCGRCGCIGRRMCRSTPDSDECIVVIGERFTCARA